MSAAKTGPGPFSWFLDLKVSIVYVNLKANKESKLPLFLNLLFKNVLSKDFTYQIQNLSSRVERLLSLCTEAQRKD